MFGRGIYHTSTATIRWESAFLYMLRVSSGAIGTDRGIMLILSVGKYSKSRTADELGRVPRSARARWHKEGVA